MKSYTDIEQSKNLAKILPHESADLKWFFWMEESNASKTPSFGYSKIMAETYKETDAIYLPCWSLSALLGVLQIYTTPTAFSTNISVPSLTKTKNGYSITYVGNYRIMESNNDIDSPIEIIADNPIDACVNMIIKLNKLNLL